MQNEQQISALKDELETRLASFSTEISKELALKREILDNASKNQMVLYSDSIRNLGIISGVVAPLSLSLLTVQTIDVHIPLLLFGFICLIGDMVFSQLVLQAQIDAKDKRLVLAEFEWFNAETIKSELENKKTESVLRVNKMFDYLASSKKLDGLLELSSFNVGSKKTQYNFRRQNTRAQFVFALGCTALVFSTFMNLLWPPF